MSNNANKPIKQTLVEEGTDFKGTLTSTCPVVVMGSVDGELQAPALNIATTGTVVGKIKAQKISSQGELAGTVEADDVSLSGVVRSDTVLRAKTLEVKLVAEGGKLEVTFGKCVVDVGDEPNRREERKPNDTREIASENVHAAVSANERNGMSASVRIDHGDEDLNAILK